jgi:hypothetical protein
LAELVQFTGDEKQDAHDDQVDAFAFGVICLDQTGTAQFWSDAKETEEEPTPRTWRELYDFHQQGTGRGGISNQERRNLYGCAGRSSGMRMTEGFLDAAGDAW